MPSLGRRLCERLSRVYLSHMDLQRMPIDTSTSSGRDCLKRRLKRLSKIIIQRQKGVSARRQPVSSVRRCASHDKFDSRHYQVLKCIVGPEMLHELQTVSQEIINIRNSSILWTQFTSQNPLILLLLREMVRKIKSDDDMDMECKGGEEEEAVDEEEEEDYHLPPLGMPTPIADIYFKTHLVERMQQATMAVLSCDSFIQVGGEALMINSATSCKCIVHRTNWKELLSDSKTMLVAYRKFEAKSLKR
jgi:hypothetical protein